ncbi:membrane protein insertase YidC [Oceanobacillus piezotolerans]|uniref:Membrane protein insertase YidC n=1 Tax=Oceanobacillus piezotolerans TaxID=2448030 RepID=A0A498D6R7_9BACI|nr:membrane protein insertase YidC [Oceanobacillus piezotolerans]RLL43704.1 membrane protein insertase YidC [Oceanobacillus piezotolerans]
MERTSLFTFFKRTSIITIILLLVLLAGCQGAVTEPIEAGTTGVFNHYFIYPFSELIKGIASLFHDNYGLSIIIITFMIRIVLMPFFLKQTKSSVQMRDKMSVIKPEMDALQEKYQNKQDKESQMMKQQELMNLYQKHGMNPLATLGGCLPMLIQFPILIAFYYAILRTPEIATHSFLWFNLGQTDIWITLCAVIIYYFQFKVSQLGMDPKMKQQMAIMGIISPLMIGFISFSAPAALPLYWAVGGLFMIAQTMIVKKFYTSKDSDTAS